MRRALILVLLLTVVSGCAIVRQSDQITVERQKFINAYARARILYAAVAERMARFCEAGRIDAAECGRMAALHQQAKIVDAEIRAKIDTPDTEVDWTLVMKLLELAVGIAL